MEGRRLRLNPDVFDLAEFGVLNWLRLEGRMKAVVRSLTPGDTADSAMGVGRAATGVWPSSPWKNLDFCPPRSPKDVMSFKADVFAMLRCGPMLTDGGERGGDRISGMFECAASSMLWKLT
jgi:hypothetical protein